MDVSALTELFGSEVAAKIIGAIIYAFALIGFFNIVTAFLLSIEKMDEKGLSEGWLKSYIILSIIGFIALKLI